MQKLFTRALSPIFANITVDILDDLNEVEVTPSLIFKCSQTCLIVFTMKLSYSNSFTCIQLKLSLPLCIDLYISRDQLRLCFSMLMINQDLCLRITSVITVRKIYHRASYSSITLSTKVLDFLSLMCEVYSPTVCMSQT